MFLELAIIFAITYIGNMINKFFIPSIPGSVLGMILLFLLLIFKVIKLKHVSGAANFLLLNMAIFFVAPGVKLIDNLDLLKDTWVQILFLCIVTMALTMGVTGLTVQWLIRKKEEKGV